MEKIIVDGEEIMVEEKEQSDTSVSTITVEEKKWSLKKKLLVLGGAILGVGLTAWAVIAKSNSKTDESEESFDEDDDDDSTENDSYDEPDSDTKTEF